MKRYLPMARFLLGRSVSIVLVLATLIFALLRIAPGDPAELIAGPSASPADIELIAEKWGLREPIYHQYGVFIGRLVQGDMGESWRSRRPVVTELADRLPATVELAVASMIIAALIGVAAGLVSAARPNSWYDNVVRVLSLLGISTPNFVRALLLVLVFAVWLGWLPAAGRGSLAYLVLPATALGIHTAALVARMLRSSLLEALSQDYIRTARSKGLRESHILVKHGLRNALGPTLTLAGVQFASLLAGAVVIETIFNWPGLGRLLIDSIRARDFPVVQGAVIMFGLVIATVNLIVDLLYSVLDPRVTYGGGLQS